MASGSPPLMFCLECKRLCLKGDHCDRCGKPLPGFSPPPPAPSNAEKLRRQTLLLRSGDLELSGFLDFLDRHLKSSQQLLQDTREDNFDPSARAEMLEELSTGTRGLLAYVQGLESLRAWTVSRDDEDLKRGLALAEQADTLVEQAVQLNWRTHRTHVETTREFLQQMGYPETE